MTYNSKYFLSFAALAFATTNALIVTPTDDATALANAVLGPGITLVSATYSGASGSSGTYTDGPLGIRDSIVMTSGNAIDTVPGPGTSEELSKDRNTAGSALCQSLNGGVQTYDAAVLSMDVILETGYAGFFSEFVFASEEYPEWVGSDFNDVFGIWIDGKQIAVDSTGAPVTINGGFFSSADVVTPPASGSSFDGSTPLLRAGGSVIAPGAHTIQVAICDTADSLLDSSVFLALGACTDAENCKTGAVKAPPVTSTSTTSTSTTSMSVISNTTIVAPVTTVPANTSTVVVLPTTSSIIPTTNVTLPEVTSTTVTAVLPIGTNPTAPIVTGPISSVHTSSVTAPYGNSTVIVAPTNTGSSVITAAPLPTDDEEAPCVTYTSYITKTFTKCDQTACHATTTVKPTVVTSTLHLTVYTPCSTVTVSKCAGAECVTYTNTVTYPAVTGYPPVPTFEAPAVSTVTPVSACTPGVNCPHVHPASSSGVAVPSAPVVGAPGAPASSAGVATPSAPVACGINCPHGHPTSSEGVAVPSAPATGAPGAPATSAGVAVPSAPGAPASSAGVAVPSAPSACTPGVNCPHGHPASSEGVAVPSAPATGAPGAPATSAGVAVPSAPGAPVSSAGVAVPSAPSACTPGVDCAHPASVTGGPVVSPVAVPAVHNTTVSAVNSTTSTSSSTTSHSTSHSTTSTISTKTTAHPVKPTATPAGALFEGAANRVHGAAGVMVGLMVAGFVALL
ncbi:uncharacterized protein H6S33_006298 [Morchella sextelata]|uniref:uncharacterized protein n=1 Tax=Morchella sextelata TaxID=1174677 RepID=UPI001D0573FB|nr:uncharacterized protein H6S33_006298 [Morchella sextelata]KAH0604630.1 hypothetical protein H6S33_006298 [Morchella sextelata]